MLVTAAAAAAAYAAEIDSSFRLPSPPRRPPAPDDPRAYVLGLFARYCPGWVITEARAWTAYVRAPGEYGSLYLLDIGSGKIYAVAYTARGARRRGRELRDLVWRDTVGL